MNRNLLIFGALGLGAYLVFGNKGPIVGPSPGDSNSAPTPNPNAPLTVLMRDAATGTVLLSDGRRMTNAQWLQTQRLSF